MSWSPPLPTCPRRVASPRIPARDQLRDNAHRDLRNSLRADVVTQRRMHAVQHFFLDPLRDQILKDHPDLALAADHPDVATRGRRKLVERLLVVAVAACENHRECRVGQGRGQFAERHADVADETTAGGGESLRAGKAVAVVEDPDVEADVRGEPRNRLSDMASADEKDRDSRESRKIGDPTSRRGTRPRREWLEFYRNAVPRLPLGDVHHPLPGRVEEVTVADWKSGAVGNYQRFRESRPPLCQFA